MRLVAKVKRKVIWMLDWYICVWLLDHKIPKYCEWVAFHPWWDAE